MASFKAGDVVKLRSGGPIMTVKGITATGSALFCMWFNDKDEVKEHLFAPEMLELVDMATSSPNGYISQP
jgi:uncharacterized protein YodC (DUF2158 family)